MKLSTFGKILRGVGQGAAIAAQLTPIGGATAAGIRVGLKVAEKAGGASADVLDPLSPNPSTGTEGTVQGIMHLELDEVEGMTLRECAVYHVLIQQEAMAIQYTEYLKRNAGQHGILMFPEYLAFMTGNIERWLAHEQILAMEAAKELPKSNDGEKRWKADEAEEKKAWEEAQALKKENGKEGGK